MLSEAVCSPIFESNTSNVCFSQEHFWFTMVMLKICACLGTISGYGFVFAKISSGLERCTGRAAQEVVFWTNSATLRSNLYTNQKSRTLS